MADLLVEGAAGGLTWLLQAAATDVVEPAVVDAAQAAILESAVREVGSSVGTVQPQQTWAALLVAEEHQVLAQQPHRERGAADGITLEWSRFT